MLVKKSDKVVGNMIVIDNSNNTENINVNDKYDSAENSKTSKEVLLENETCS